MISKSGFSVMHESCINDATSIAMTCRKKYQCVTNDESILKPDLCEKIKKKMSGIPAMKLKNSF